MGRDQHRAPPPQPATARPLSPDRQLRTRACARAPVRGLARRRERALCGRCRHVVVVVRRRQWRRSGQTRRSSGPGAAPRRPWLGASWGGGGGRAVAGLAMSCRRVRSPPPLVSSEVEEELEEGPASAPARWLSPSGRGGGPRGAVDGVRASETDVQGGGRRRRGKGWGGGARWPGSARTLGSGEAGSRARRPSRTWRDGPLGLGI